MSHVFLTFSCEFLNSTAEKQSLCTHKICRCGVSPRFSFKEMFLWKLMSLLKAYRKSEKYLVCISLTCQWRCRGCEGSTRSTRGRPSRCRSHTWGTRTASSLTQEIMLNSANKSTKWPLFSPPPSSLIGPVLANWHQLFCHHYNIIPQYFHIFELDYFLPMK